LRPRQLLVRATRLDGAQRGVLAVFTDVTETRRLENVRREFVANVSHELRTPVTSIRSAGESLEAALDRPEMARKFLDIIDRNGERLQVLVEDLLDLSRIESRQYSLSMEAIELSPFVKHVLALYTERAERASVSLQMEFAQPLPRVFADRRALEHVVSNLVDNALKYGAAGRIVHVSAVAQGDRLLLRVRDKGPGIPRVHLARIFERFYRIDAGRSRDMGGTGLGLSIVKNLAESMGGLASVESEEGVGTTFTVSLQSATA
jgi:two-component system phosphate regulon sensor histidine kinase PhoR